MTRVFQHYKMWLSAAFLFASGNVFADAVEDANKQLVLDFYAALDKADAKGNMSQQIQSIAEKFLSPDYHQNSDKLANLPGPGTHRDKLIRMFQSMPTMPVGPAPAAPKLESIMAENDLVMMLTSRSMPDPVSGSAKKNYIFNMFRVKDGLLVEHWDVSAGMGGAPGAQMPGNGQPPAGMPPKP